MAECLFLIGPGGAGKSTVGKYLSARLGYRAIDLDDEFCARIMNIREYIAAHGYESYLEQNALLLPLLQQEYAQQPRVLILSSGFLATDIRPDIVEQNKKQVAEQGISVLLLPSRHHDEAMSCIVERQLLRGFSLVREKEQQKFSQRFYQYLKLGDIQVFSMAEPASIASEIEHQWALYRKKHPQAAL